MACNFIPYFTSFSYKCKALFFFLYQEKTLNDLRMIVKVDCKPNCQFSWIHFEFKLHFSPVLNPVYLVIQTPNLYNSGPDWQ